MENIVLQKEIEAKLAEYHDPYLERDLLAAKAIKGINIEENKITIDIVLGYPHLGIKKTIIQTINQLLAPLAIDKTVEITLSTQIEAHVGKQGMQALPNIKNIIAIASGKGGV